MSRLCALPDEVLKLVMQHVPLQDRLGSCCLANRRMQAAAVAATQELVLCMSVARWEVDEVSPRNKVVVDSPELMQSALEWLVPYGQHLTSLQMRRFRNPLHDLPCPNLLELVLDGYEGSVQLDQATDGAPGVIQGCTKLTKLEARCNIIDGPRAGSAIVDNLSTLVGLQHLHLKQPGFQKPATLLCGRLPAFKHLTHLHVESLSLESLLQVAALTSLKELNLFAADGITVGPNSVPGFTLPGSLTHLVLSARVEAEILSVAPTGLRHLTLSYHGCLVEGPVDGPGSFLSCIARLQHLTELQIDLLDQLHWPPPGPAYSALTASSHLVCLDIDVARLKCVWRYVFPAGRKLPHLTSLRSETDTGFPEVFQPSAWGAADVSSLVSCCPNLCELGPIGMQHGPHVSELHKLTALTHLHVVYCFPEEFADIEESLRGLAAVTQLRYLRFFQDYNLGHEEEIARALRPLTSLTALTAFWAGGYSDYNLELDSTHAGSVPDVWLKLLQHCIEEADPAADTNCDSDSELGKLTALHTLALQVLTEHKAAAAQQVAELHAVVTQQQQHIVAQQQLIATQQQQLLAQQQLAAQQSARIASLEGVLQQLLQRQLP